MKSVKSVATTEFEYVSRKDAMGLLDVRRDFLIERQSSGELPWYMVGKKVYYRISDLNALVRRGRQI